MIHTFAQHTNGLTENDKINLSLFILFLDLKFSHEFIAFFVVAAVGVVVECGIISVNSLA